VSDYVDSGRTGSGPVPGSGSGAAPGDPGYDPAYGGPAYGAAPAGAAPRPADGDDPFPPGLAPADGSGGYHGSGGDDDGGDDGGSGRPPRPTPPPSPGATLFSLVREVVLVLVIALGLSLVIKTFVVQAFFIPSPSMEATLIRGDRVLVAKQHFGPFKLQRGDVVVFQDPDHWLEPEATVPEGAVRGAIKSGLTAVGLLPADSDEHLIKRVIGMPGDKVVCCDAKDRLTVNGVALNEPYIYGDDKPSEIKFSVTVPAGSIWVMGDHRSVSQDSRYHQDEPGDGTVATKYVVGRAFVKVWPLSRIGWLHIPTSTFAGVPSPGS
jgi:signal peptidase I